MIAIYKTAEELQKKIEEYFKTGIPVRKVIVGPPNNRTEAFIPVPTITGLVLFCGFDSRQSFYDYEKREKFTSTIKRARTFIEKEYEESLQSGGGAGAIFALKNFGWKDERSLEHTIKPEELQKYISSIVEILNVHLEADVKKKIFSELEKAGIIK